MAVQIRWQLCSRGAKGTPQPVCIGLRYANPRPGYCCCFSDGVGREWDLACNSAVAQAAPCSATLSVLRHRHGSSPVSLRCADEVIAPAGSYCMQCSHVSCRCCERRPNLQLWHTDALCKFLPLRWSSHSFWRIVRLVCSLVHLCWKLPSR